MIEKYYAVHIKTSLDAAAINVVRSKKTGWRKRKYELCDESRRAQPGST